MYGRKKENNVKLKLLTKQSVCQVLLLSLFLPGGVSDVNSSRLCRYPAFVSFRSLFGVFQYSIYRYRHSSLSSCGDERSYNWHLNSIVELHANNRCFFLGGGGGAAIFQKNPNMDDIEWRLALVLDMQRLYEYPSKLFKFTRQDTCFLICKRKFLFQSLMFAELKNWAMERKPGWNLCFSPLAFHILVLI